MKSKHRVLQKKRTKHIQIQKQMLVSNNAHTSVGVGVYGVYGVVWCVIIDTRNVGVGVGRVRV